MGRELNVFHVIQENILTHQVGIVEDILAMVQIDPDAQTDMFVLQKVLLIRFFVQHQLFQIAIVLSASLERKNNKLWRAVVIFIKLKNNYLFQFSFIQKN